MQPRLSRFLIIALSLVSFCNLAQAGLTANAGVTSNYVFRGVTQTDDGAAIQGGIDYTHDVGLYLGAWASNVEDGAGNDGFEADLYIGFKLGLPNNMALDVGYIAYEYTDSNWADAEEVYFGFIFDQLSITYFDGDVEGGGNADYNYIDVKYAIGLPSNFRLLLHYGHLDNQNAPNVDDASIGISKDFGSGFEGNVTFTTIDGTNNDDEEVFVTIVKTFDI